MTTHPTITDFKSVATVVFLSLTLVFILPLGNIHAGNSGNLSKETAEIVLQQQDTLSPDNWTSHYAVNPLSMQNHAITILTKKDFNPGSNINVWNLILGRMPGLNISHEDGEPGGGTSARNNYASSAREWPLIVIDGVPLIREFPDGMRNPLNFLHHDDIETVSYLRPAASSVHGMRGSNGVLIITTRKPDKDAPVRFSYSGNVSLATATQTPDVLSTEAFTQQINERYADQPNILSLMGSATTQWQDEIYRNAAGHNHHLAASGTTVAIPWRASLNYTDQAGVLNTDQLQRIGTQLSFQPSLLDDHLQVSLNLHASQLENRLAPQNAILNAIRFDPTQPVYNSDSPYGGYFAYTNTEGIPIPLAPANPVALLSQTNNTDQTTTLSAQTQINYRLRSLPGLSLHLLASQQQFNSDYKGLTPGNASWEYYSGGRKTENQEEYQSGFMEAWARYQTGIFYGGHSLETSMGITRHNTRYDYSFSTTNLENNAAGVPSQVFKDTHGWSETYFRSFFATTGYNFNDRYLLFLNVRNDATSRLADDNRSAIYYGVSASWQVHNESFWPENSFLSVLQPRLSYGTHGMIPVFSQMANTYFPNSSYILDMNLKPEKRTTLNGGIDIALLNNRITLSAYYHQTNHKELILPIIIPPAANMPSIILANIGEAESSGWDISLHALPVVTENISWSISTHFSSFSNEIIRLNHFTDDNEGFGFGPSNNFINTPGYPFSSFFVLQSIYNNEGYPQPNMYVDQNQDGMITQDDFIRYQTPYPDYSVGIASQLQWHNWNVEFSGRFLSGNYVYNNTSSFFGNYSNLYRPEGPYLGNIASEALDLNLEYQEFFSDYFVQDATFFRMDFISLGYRLGGLLQDALNLTLTATVQNAFVLTNYEGMDPEVPSGIDFARYPRPRTFVLGVKMDF
ncbi:MAG: SusC/RagA family TonB-linked outer membrane protein [Bacteroidota bacterium]